MLTFFWLTRWCSEGGQIYLCDFCPQAFCNKCLRWNLGRYWCWPGLRKNIKKSYLRKYLKKLEEEDKWKCLNCDPSPLREQRAHFWAITRFHKVAALQVLTMFSFASSIFSCQEKLSAKIGKLPAANPSTPATPKKNSKVCFRREKQV